MITKIEASRFRGHAHLILNFGPGVNHIIGKNEAGKTTVAEAIAFAFFGCDTLGARSPDHLISLGEESTEVVLSTDKAEFLRFKRRGQPSVFKLKRGNLPLISLTQSELSQLLGVSWELFASCYLPGYFLRLPEAKRMEVIAQVVKVDRLTILKRLLPGITIPSKVKLESIKTDALTIASERRVCQNQLISDTSTLSSAREQLKELSELSGSNPAEMQKEIEGLTALSDLFHIYQQELNIYSLARSRAKEIEESNQRIQAERTKVELELKSIENTVHPDIAVLEEEGRKILKEDGLLSLQTRAAPEVPRVVELKSEETTCSRCGSFITAKLRESAEKERANLLTAYNKLAREVEDHNQAVLQRREVLNKAYHQNQKQLLELQRNLVEETSHKATLRSRLSDLRIKDVKIPPPPIKPTADEKQVRERLSDLKSKHYALQMLGQKKQSLESKVTTLSEATAKRKLYIEELTLVEKALLKVPEMEVREILDGLAMKNTHAFFNEEGMLEFTDPRRLPYSCLSQGRKMKMDLEISETFQRKVAKAPHFYFLDDADLIDLYEDLLPQGEQVLVAKVDSEVPSVQVVPLE